MNLKRVLMVVALLSVALLDHNMNACANARRTSVPGSKPAPKIAPSETAQATAEKVFEKVLRQFVTSFTKKDIKSLMAQWSTKSPQFTEFEEFALYQFATFNNLLSADAKGRGTVEAKKATLRIWITLISFDLATGRIVQQLTVWDVELVKEVEAWKWWRQKDAIHLFYTMLRQAKTKAERARLLKKEKELVTPQVVDYFIRESATHEQQDNPLVALKLNDIALEAAEVLGDKSLLAQCWGSRGALLYHQTKYRVAVANFQHALSLSQQAKDKKGQGAMLLVMGRCYQSVGDYANALDTYQQSLKIAREASDKTVEAALLNYIGEAYQSEGKRSEAQTQFEASLKLAKEAGDQITGQQIGIMGVTLTNMGEMYRLAGKYEKALEQHQASQQLLQHCSAPEEQTILLCNIAKVHQSSGKSDKALPLYQDAVRMFERLGLKGREAETRNNIGKIYESTNRSAEALAQFETSLKLAKEIGHKEIEAESLANITRVRATINNN